MRARAQDLFLGAVVVLIMVAVTILIIAVPVTLGMPAMLPRTPPAVILVPAALTLGIETLALLLGFVTTLAVTADCLV